MNPYPDPAFSNADPDPVPDLDLGFDDQKFNKITAGKNTIFLIKNCNILFLSLGLYEGRPSYRRSLQPSKENIQHFKT